MAFVTHHNLGHATDARRHFTLLDNSPERVLGLRFALSQVIRSDSLVLDAGCGRLGYLATMAAILGAEKVLGVDLGEPNLAKLIAEHNNVDTKVTFIKSDLNKLNLLKEITAVRLIVEQNQLVSVVGDYCCGLRRLQGA